MLGLARQLLTALQHVTGKGILHRDLKPDNLLITGDGMLKLAAFGLGQGVADPPI